MQAIIEDLKKMKHPKEKLKNFKSSLKNYCPLRNGFCLLLIAVNNFMSIKCQTHVFQTRSNHSKTKVLSTQNNNVCLPWRLSIKNLFGCWASKPKKVNKEILSGQMYISFFWQQQYLQHFIVLIYCPNHQNALFGPCKHSPLFQPLSNTKIIGNLRSCIRVAVLCCFCCNWERNECRYVTDSW